MSPRDLVPSHQHVEFWAWINGRRRFFGEYEKSLIAHADTAIFYPLPADHLLSLIYYNVWRALVRNSQLLRLDQSQMCCDDYISPFYGAAPNSAALDDIPTSLSPTYLQCTMRHHPQVDIFPDPVIRDNMLRIGDDNVDQDELCMDLIECGESDPACYSQVPTGAIVWGEPWDIRSWEVTETFARKWCHILKGASKLFLSTNLWRQRRGEPPLSFEAILGARPGD